MLKLKRETQPMPYTLITRKGRIMQFYIKEVAELYQQNEGGVFFTQDILQEKEVDAIKNENV